MLSRTGSLTTSRALGEPGGRRICGCSSPDALRAAETPPWSSPATASGFTSKRRTSVGTWPQTSRPDMASHWGGIDRREDIDEGSTITFLDAAGFGRIAVLICEDLKAGAPPQLVNAATATCVLSPIMDGSLAAGRWAEQAARRLSDEPGALVLVVNRLVLGLRQRRLSGKPEGPIGVCLVAHPTDHQQSGICDCEPSTEVVHRDLHWRQVG